MEEEMKERGIATNNIARQKTRSRLWLTEKRKRSDTTTATARGLGVKYAANAGGIQVEFGGWG